MIGTMTIGMGETLLALESGTHEGTFAGMETLMGFELAGLGEGSMAARIIAGIGSFTWIGFGLGIIISFGGWR